MIFPATQNNQNMAEEVGPVIEAAQLEQTILQNVLDRMGAINRKIVIGIANETPSNWQALNVYFFTGASEAILPEFVKSRKAVLYNARKRTGPVVTGSVGVLTYYMPDVQKTIAVLFSVPFDYNLFRNWWDVKAYNGEKRADYYMYRDLYYGNPVRGDDGWYTKNIGEGYSVKGIMTGAGTCKLQLKIFK